jgi:hypothetical protein
MLCTFRWFYETLCMFRVMDEIHSGDFSEGVPFIHKCLINCGTQRGTVMIKICRCVREHEECVGGID